MTAMVIVLGLSVIALAPFAVAGAQPTPGTEEPPITVPTTIYKAIRALDPGAVIVQSGDIDPARCGDIRQPGVVRADFDGDGRLDHAVLLRVGEPKAMPGPDGRAVPVVANWLVAFLDTKFGLQSYVIEQGGAYVPSIEVISLQPAGTVREVGAGTSGQSVRLRRPAIRKTFCGKATAVYRWNRDRVRFDAVLTEASPEARHDTVVCSRLVIGRSGIACGSPAPTRGR